MCRFYQRGECKFGDRCFDIHENPGNQQGFGGQYGGFEQKRDGHASDFSNGSKKGPKYKKPNSNKLCPYLLKKGRCTPVSGVCSYSHDLNKMEVEFNHNDVANDFERFKQLKYKYSCYGYEGEQSMVTGCDWSPEELRLNFLKFQMANAPQKYVSAFTLFALQSLI